MVLLVIHLRDSVISSECSFYPWCIVYESIFIELEPDR